jgi:hypothetical protein
MSQRPSLVAFHGDRSGIGQSMAVASVGWLLAINGLRVVAIDWDLGKPSLHKYYMPFLSPDMLSCVHGIIDFVWEYALATRHAATIDTAEWRERVARFAPCACAIPPDLALQPSGVLDLVPAGGESSREVRVRYFSWPEFLDRLDGTNVLAAFFEHMTSRYDHVLVDCPAGRVTGGTTFPLLSADVLVPCFTLDRESITATSPMAKWAAERVAGRKVLVYPLAMRVQLSEKSLLDEALVATRDAFAWVTQPPNLTRTHGDWAPVCVPEIPHFVYQRALPPLVDRPGSYGTTAAYQALASAISGRGNIEWRPASDEQWRSYAAEYRIAQTGAADLMRPIPQPYHGQSSYAFVSYARDDRDRVLPILQDLIELGFRLWWDEEIPGGVDWHGYLAKRIQNCQGMLVFLTNRSAGSPYVAEELQIGHESGKPLLSIRLDWSALSSEVETVLGRYQMLDVAVEGFSAELARAMHSLIDSAGGA